MTVSAIELTTPIAEVVQITQDTLRVELSDGRTISAPLAWFPRLFHASTKERANWRLIGRGHGDGPFGEDRLGIAAAPTPEATPAPFLRPFDQVSPKGVSLDVATDGQKGRIALDGEELESPLV